MVKGAAANLIRVEMWNRHDNVQKLPFWGTSYSDSSESVVSAMSVSFGWRALRHGTARFYSSPQYRGSECQKAQTLQAVNAAETPLCKPSPGPRVARPVWFTSPFVIMLNSRPGPLGRRIAQSVSMLAILIDLDSGHFTPVVEPDHRSPIIIDSQFTKFIDFIDNSAGHSGHHGHNVYRSQDTSNFEQYWQIYGIVTCEFQLKPTQPQLKGHRERCLSIKMSFSDSSVLNPEYANSFARRKQISKLEESSSAPIEGSTLEADTDLLGFRSIFTTLEVGILALPSDSIIIIIIIIIIMVNWPLRGAPVLRNRFLDNGQNHQNSRIQWQGQYSSFRYGEHQSGNQGAVTHRADAVLIAAGHCRFGLEALPSFRRSIRSLSSRIDKPSNEPPCNNPRRRKQSVLGVAKVYVRKVLQSEAHETYSGCGHDIQESTLSCFIEDSPPGQKQSYSDQSCSQTSYGPWTNILAITLSAAGMNNERTTDTTDSRVKGGVRDTSGRCLRSRLTVVGHDEEGKEPVWLMVEVAKIEESIVAVVAYERAARGIQVWVQNIRLLIRPWLRDIGFRIDTCLANFIDKVFSTVVAHCLRGEGGGGWGEGIERSGKRKEEESELELKSRRAEEKKAGASLSLYTHLGMDMLI
ncbi:hypothetical protein PCH_Pc12g15700 [Penicillium rubens Wisconsin 54-1255]|uniref:Uncharacterized protein n=1 Tax=Penicillium rubens (strain ATCC 28089 / DSM 1075 / NRRL 1951 / Wisconsin 54-1255) TaxID=500485 RepID=B6GY38_PENRW|nr:hypothetical protein PCH_Pc12g15700 [Penicillium rubens Wisconsin 54-1255]